LIDLALKGQHLDEASLRLINAYEPGVAIMAAFTRYMVADDGEDPKAVNELLNIVVEALHQLPPSVRTGLFQDRMGWGDFVKLMLQMQKLHPNIWEAVPRKLGVVYTWAWVLNFIEFSSFALQKQLAAVAGEFGQGVREDFYNYANYYRYALA
jgi:lycopene cyclase CruA